MFISNFESHIPYNTLESDLNDEKLDVPSETLMSPPKRPNKNWILLPPCELPGWPTIENKTLKYPWTKNFTQNIIKLANTWKKLPSNYTGFGLFAPKWVFFEDFFLARPLPTPICVLNALHLV